MPSNCNESIRSCAVYRPPHLRKEFVETKYSLSDNSNNTSSLNNNTSSLNNNIFNYVNNNSKVNINNALNLEIKETLTKLYIPPAKRDLNYVGRQYFDRKFKGTRIEYSKRLEESTTVYVGHLNLLSTEEDILKLFSEAGKIKTIIMGLDRYKLTPGGFCFIEYETRAGTENCMKIMNGVLLDGKQLLVDWDAGFIEGRQYRRGKRNHQRSHVHPNIQK